MPKKDTPTGPRTPLKEKRAWRLTDECFLLFEAMAQEVGQDIPGFLEMISRELAQHRLSQAKRESIKEEAAHRAAERLAHRSAHAQ